MNKTLLALYGLKWNPFAPSVPAEALHVSSRVDSFCRRVRHLVAEGGFAVVTGEPGTGKSACLRILADQLANERDVKVGTISRPQANIADFYREMGDLFGVQLRPHNRWGGAKILRQSCRRISTARCPDRCSSSTRPRRWPLRFFPNCACSPPPSSIPTSC